MVAAVGKLCSCIAAVGVITSDCSFRGDGVGDFLDKFSGC